MRGFELTAARQRTYESTVRDVPYPVQMIWPTGDPAAPLETSGEKFRVAAGIDPADVHTLPAPHFLQEEHPEAIAELVARQAEGAGAA